MGHRVSGIGHGKHLLLPMFIAHCPMPNAQCPLITNYKKTRTSRGCDRLRSASFVMSHSLAA
ncbi:hypothetical protein [Tolypothrix sp. VBCCA 56010]|uniref:hypothetical protein n=1 Tax=Tolypothrix sp. VBCCA 56010 TaxID=3137731 RepID=UPI003D7E3771